MDLIKKFMKIGGAQTAQQLLDMYPTEEAFFAAHPEARKMAMGGMPEAFPQIATFEKAFSYGVPPGPQYLAGGGSAFPQAQTEQQFFIPIYTDVYNPYNKAMGGSNVEVFPNAKTTPHWGPSNVWFQNGGQDMPEQAEGPDRLGVLNMTGSFVTNLKQSAANANKKNALMGAINKYGMAKYGKQLNTYAPGGYTVNPNQRIASNVTQQMSPTSSQFAGEAMPPTYNQQLQGNTLAYLSSMGYNPNMIAAMQQGYNPQATGYMNDFYPSIYGWNNPNQFAYTVKGQPSQKWRLDAPGERRSRGNSNMPFHMTLGNTPEERAALMAKNNVRMTEKPIGIFGKRTQRDYYFDGPDAQTPTTFKDWGTGTGAQNVPPQMPQASSAYGPYADGFAYGTDGSSAANPMEGDVNAPMLAPGQQGYDPTVRSTQSPTFDQNGMLNQISKNENTNFGTKSINEILKPGASQDWRDYKIDNTPGAAYDSPDKVKAAWDSTLANNPKKKEQWEAFGDMPAPLQAVAQDQLFNSSFDPRVVALAAAGVDQGYTGKGAPVLSNDEYRKWLKGDVDTLWNKNKNLINQQYNDDPQAFTETVSSNRDIAYQKTRTPDVNGQLTDFPSTSGGPGTQYPAWSGRTKATQDYVDNTYFNSANGYVAPQFLQNRISQAPSNANSMDAATAQKKASMMSPNVNQAYIDAQKAVPSFPTEAYNQFMPQMPNMAGAGYMSRVPNTAGPREGFAYGGIPKAQAGFQAPWQKTLDMVNPQNYKINSTTGKSEYNPVIQSADVNTGQILPEGSHFRETTLDPNIQKLKAAFTGPQGFATIEGIKAGATNLINANAANQLDPMAKYRTVEDIYTAQAAGKGNQNVLSGDMYPYKNNYATYDPFTRMAKQGGQIKQGDVRYMSDAEIAEFVRNGGEIEYLD